MLGVHSANNARSLRWYSDTVHVGSNAAGKARQTRFIVLHQSLTRFACGWVVIIHDSLLAYAIYTRQIHGTSQCVIACKVIMTVEVAGLRGSGR